MLCRGISHGAEVFTRRREFISVEHDTVCLHLICSVVGLKSQQVTQPNFCFTFYMHAYHNAHTFYWHPNGFQNTYGRNPILAASWIGVKSLKLTRVGLASGHFSHYSKITWDIQVVYSSIHALMAQILLVNLEFGVLCNKFGTGL